MLTEELQYDLPEELIAQRPSDVRSESRLLVLDRSGGSIADRRFSDLGRYVDAGDCLVLNDTKVLPARFYGRRATGGAVEGLFLEERQPGRWLVMLKGLRKVKPDEYIVLRDRQRADFCRARVVEKLEKGRCVLEIESGLSTGAVLERAGFPPLPPYIKRDDNPEIAAADACRYQTVYAARDGAVAAPTAGLHFTEELIGQLKGAGVVFATVTLHVGAGTFKPVSAERLEDHEIHREVYSVDEHNAAIINEARQRGKRIIAVGTTSVRTLETVGATGAVRAESGSTQLFITPGYRFNIVDAMITNFHLPRSTLLALVAAFAGLETTLNAYEHAVRQRYRFYSYGDAMLIT